MTNRGQLLLIPGNTSVASAALRAFDEFTDVDGTALGSHTASDGGTWTKNAAFPTGVATIDNNILHSSNDTNQHPYHHSWVPTTADYEVAADIILVSDNNTSYIGVAGRMSTTVNTCYLFRYDTSANVWELYKFVSGVGVASLATATATLTVAQRYRVRLVMVGTLLRGFVDGVLVASATDSAITAAGRAGVRMANAATSTTGVHVDSWEATS